MDETFEDLVETFAFLDDWEDRYRHIIELGKAMPEFPEALKTAANKVEGCASQVWLSIEIDDASVLRFRGTSDAMIVKGLIAVLILLYSGKTLAEVEAIDALSALDALGLAAHLSAQRSNGLRAMVQRLQATAHAAQKNV